MPSYYDKIKFRRLWGFSHGAATERWPSGRHDGASGVIVRLDARLNADLRARS
jgi:hypothetical protein